MKGISYFKSVEVERGKVTYSIIVNKKELVDKIQKMIVLIYIAVSILAGVASVLMMADCYDQKTPVTLSQRLTIFCCGLSFLFFVRMINKKRFNEFFLNIWEIIKETSLEIHERTSHMYDKK